MIRRSHRVVRGEEVIAAVIEKVDGDVTLELPTCTDSMWGTEASLDLTVDEARELHSALGAALPEGADER